MRAEPRQRKERKQVVTPTVKDDDAVGNAAEQVALADDPASWRAFNEWYATTKEAKNTKKRLEELRTILRSESISMGELIELQGLAEYIDPSDVELLEAAGVSEFPEDDDE